MELDVVAVDDVVADGDVVTVGVEGYGVNRWNGSGREGGPYRERSWMEVW
jgi:hypothetical protein